MTNMAQSGSGNRSNGIVPSEMISMIGYAVRTPLHGASGWIELLADSDLDHDQKRMIEQAQTSLDDLGAMVDRLLDLARVESGRLELHPVETSVIDMIEYVVEQSDGRAKPGVLVSAVCPPSIPKVLADSYRLAQVLDILVDNATGASVMGSVEVKVELVNRDASMAESNAITVCFSVIDTGPGMSDEVRADLLMPFWEQQRSTPNSGIGTGLSLANRLLGLMDSELEITSTPGKGTTVSFFLSLEQIASGPGDSQPLRSVAERFEFTATNVESLPQATGSILVVEDNEVNRVLAERQLTKLGYEVTSCSSGKEGVRLATTGTFDAVLMDMQMPEIDGLEATRRIRQTETSSGNHIPIIAVTANATPLDQEKCLDAGMDGYLAKPVDIQRMNRTLQRWLKHEVVVARPDELMSQEIAPGTIEYLLASLDGDREAVCRLFESAYEELPIRRMRILAAARSASPADLVGAARALGASSRSLGVLGLAGVCRDLEEYAEQEPAEEIDGYLDRLSLACRQTESLLYATIENLRENSPLKCQSNKE